MQLTTLKKRLPQVKFVQYATTASNNCYQALFNNEVSIVLEDLVVWRITIQKTWDRIGLLSMLSQNA